ncbi:putative hydroxymethylpyrimidine transport system permease protein [Rhodobacteraceae bacterium MBR-64]|jgi:putative hydroxymethylpyrimidine transport system permease protein
MRPGQAPILAPILVAVFIVAVWQGVVWATGVAHFILPGPLRVAQSLWENRLLIGINAGRTFANIGIGLTLGAALGVLTAINLALSPMARLLMRPFLVFAQAIPVFALAPILTLWLGFGPASKIVMVVLVIYFPIASTFFDALMRLPPAMADLARNMQARPLRELIWLRLPHALPALGSGLRLGAVYAPFGAVIGEWVGASNGLGHMMLMANGRAQTDLMFAALVVLAAFTVVLFFAADLAAGWLARRFG